MIKEIHAKLKNLEGYVNLLKELKGCSKEELRDDLKLRGAVERYMQISLECVIEICEMIISEKRFGQPEGYREAILILGEEGILPMGFAKKFAPAAGFRNILVHHYAEVDLNKLYKHLQKDLRDFDTFARHIARYLKALK